MLDLEIAFLVKEKGCQQTIYPIEHAGQRFWVKARPFSKQKIWHKLQKIVSISFRLPILASTVSQGGAISLAQEAQRLTLFKEQGLAVPEVAMVNNEYLVTTDVGPSLHEILETLLPQERTELLFAAVHALSQLHGRGLYHGRPSSRDLLVKEGVIYFIDLEENPLTVMSLAEAQARDLWLFFNNMVRYSSEEALLIRLFHEYRQHSMAEEVLCHLKRLVYGLKPLRIFAQYVLQPWAGRDLINAMRANKVLETALS